MNPITKPSYTNSIVKSFNVLCYNQIITNIHFEIDTNIKKQLNKI